MTFIEMSKVITSEMLLSPPFLTQLLISLDKYHTGQRIKSGVQLEEKIFTNATKFIMALFISIFAAMYHQTLLSQVI